METEAQKQSERGAESPAETFVADHERLGRAAAEIVADYARSLDARRVCSEATPADLERLFDEPLPREGGDALEVFQRFEREIVAHAMHIPSPRYYGLFNPTPLPVAVWADALASALNQNGAAWRNSPAASVVEATVLRWLCEIVGYPPESFGTMTSGGSEANLVALKCARDRAAEAVRDEGLRRARRPNDGTNESRNDARGRNDDAGASRVGGRGRGECSDESPDGARDSSQQIGDADSLRPIGDFVVYASEQCHYSFEKGVDILGLGRRNLRKIETDDSFHIRTDLLRREIERDLANGNVPVCVAGAAGATSTGVIDPLDELADIAQQFGVWFHVDAAYGGALAMSEKYRHRLSGIERADSITIDPHKWMFVPFAAGATLVRAGARVLRDAFDITPEYLSEERGGADVPYDFFRYGQLGTRRFNALKVWAALKTVGTRGYARIIERQIGLAEHLAARVRRLEHFETVGRVETAVCNFRLAPPAVRDADELDDLQRALQQRVERSGGAWISTTVLRGRRALRANVNSFLTERRHIDDLVELLKRESSELLEGR